MTKVLVCGTFDLLHPGHVRLFKEAAKMGEVIVIVNMDDFTVRFKNKRPVLTLAERIETIEAVRYVSQVGINVGSEDMRPVIEKYQPDIIIRGSDWADDEKYLKQLGLTKGYIEAKGITLVSVPYHEGISTTLIKQRILNEKANSGAVRNN